MKVAVVVLAAGSSRRLGRPKQLLPLHGRPLLQYAVDAASGSAADDVVLVLGHAAEEILASVTLDPRVRTVRNPLHHEGQSTSLQSGLRALDARVGVAIVVLGDQPLIQSWMIDRVIAVSLEGASPIVRSRFKGGASGHPVALARSTWPAVLGVSGDVGARDIMAANSHSVRDVELGVDPLRDVDTIADYEELRADLDRPPSPPDE